MWRSCVRLFAVLRSIGGGIIETFLAGAEAER